MPIARVGIIGFGVLGRQLHQMIAVRNPGQAIVFDDDGAAAGLEGAVPFLDIGKAEYAGLDFYVALGYRHMNRKHEIVSALTGRGRSLPAFVHESSYVDPSARLGAGAIVFPRCTLGPGVTLGPGTVLHCAVTMAHDCEVGAASYLAPGVTASGFVSIGARTFIGTGTVIANGRRVGDEAIVGIGTCVTRDVASGNSVIGNPMRVLGAPLKLD
jgi:sugar O-acyltransferase (sialic acid O-acetyltransferase NeuD family)